MCSKSPLNVHIEQHWVVKWKANVSVIHFKSMTITCCLPVHLLLYWHLFTDKIFIVHKIISNSSRSNYYYYYYLVWICSQYNFYLAFFRSVPPCYLRMSRVEPSYILCDYLYYIFPHKMLPFRFEKPSDNCNVCWLLVVVFDHFTKYMIWKTD